MIFLLAIFLLAAPVSAQSIFDAEKTAWLARDGRLPDGNFNLEYGFFIWLHKDTQANYATVKSAIEKLTSLDANDPNNSWIGGNRANAVIVAQAYYWHGDKLQAAEKNLIAGRLASLPTDKYYYGIGLSNTGMNCMTARYVTSQFNKAAQVQYSTPENTSGPATFSYSGRTYAIGQTYNSYELARDWILNWFDSYVGNAYIHGEVFSELYGMHFLNCLITLADPRTCLDPDMRNRAKMVADLYLLEMGINSNGHHLSGPLGRTYMRAHTTGDLHIFPFAPYLGQMRETWYGCPSGFYSAEYRLESFLAELCRYNDEGFDYTHTVTSGVRGGRYSYITKSYTLGSEINGGNWLLEINGNDAGRHPGARRGFPVRLWLNDKPNDLQESACSGECYATMGTDGYQWRNAVFVPRGGLIVHAPAPGSVWDALETSGAWTFYLESNVAVGIVRSGSSGAMEVSRIGVDDATFATFKAAATTKAVLTASSYKTSKGDIIDAANGRTRVNDAEVATGFNRLHVDGHRGEILVDFNGKSLVISKEGGESRHYDFSSWKIDKDSQPVDTIPPAVPRRLRVMGAN